MMEERWRVALLEAKAECGSYAEAQEDFQAKALKASEDHAKAMEKQEAQLIRTSGALAAAKQMLRQTELEVGDLRKTHRRQVAENSDILQECRLLNVDEAQAANRTMLIYSSNLLEEVEMSAAHISRLSEAHQAISDELQVTVQERIHEGSALRGVWQCVEVARSIGSTYR